MYWSRSMYEMLGYEPCDAMLSFGAVSEITHPDDLDMFDLANRILSGEGPAGRSCLPACAIVGRSVDLDPRQGAGQRPHGARRAPDRHRRSTSRAAASGPAFRSGGICGCAPPSRASRNLFVLWDADGCLRHVQHPSSSTTTASQTAMWAQAGGATRSSSAWRPSRMSAVLPTPTGPERSGHL